MLADEVDYVIGVDTHRDQHVLAIVAAPTGAIIAQPSVPTNARGYEEALRFAVRHARACGSGQWKARAITALASPASSLVGRGSQEVGRSARVERRLRGKNDPLDAVRAARSALASDTITRPRAGERQEALRLLLLARRSAVDVRRLALVQLRSVIVTAPERLRERASAAACRATDPSL